MIIHEFKNRREDKKGIIGRIRDYCSPQGWHRSYVVLYVNNEHAHPVWCVDEVEMTETVRSCTINAFGLEADARAYFRKISGENIDLLGKGLVAFWRALRGESRMLRRDYSPKVPLSFKDTNRALVPVLFSPPLLVSS